MPDLGKRRNWYGVRAVADRRLVIEEIEEIIKVEPTFREG